MENELKSIEFLRCIKKVWVSSLLLLFLCFYCTDLIAQVSKISGTVTSTDGKPIQGATVLVKGTINGSITDAQGNYTLSNVSPNATLVFSFIGMTTQFLPFEGTTVINVVLMEASIGLDEVVVIGYGTIKKRDLTGSVASVKSTDIASFPTTNVTQALQGRSAGVQIQQNTGAPGENMQVRIRGTNSIKGNNEPLWVIDGFPGDQSIVNVSDIETVEVLKDASATAIYGSRGANGVIIVTTKSGKAGPTKVEYVGSYGIQSIRKKLDLMDGREYMEFMNIQQLNDRGIAYFTQDQINSAGKGTDWQDLVFQTATVHNHSLNISGGNDKTQFSFGSGYFNQEGIILNSGYKRMSFRTNVTHEISKKLSVSFNSILTRTETDSQNNFGQQRGSSLISAMLSAAPTLTPYKDDGTYRLLNTEYPFNGSIENPLGLVKETSNKSHSNSVMANLAFTFKPIDGLSIKISGNVLNVDSRMDGYVTKKYLSSSGSAQINTGQGLSLNSDNIITYNKTINEIHKINVMGGVTYEQYTYASVGASGTGFLSDNFETYNIGSATTLGIPSSSYLKWQLLSYLGRINYSLKDKYLVTVSLRSDGSSRYSVGNKWGSFPSGALAWRVSDEDFMKSIRVISSLKLRAGYGETGSTAIDPYSTLSMLSSGKAVFDKTLYTYLAPSTTYPGNLKWETTAQTDIGLDIAFFKDRLRFTADYYIKNTRDLLNSVQMPVSTGYTTTIQNVGKIQNKGFEFQMDVVLLDKKFKWDISSSISFNRNKVVKLYNGQDITGGILGITIIQDYVNLLREGQPLGIFYGYQENGYDETGKITYKDIDGVPGITAADKTYIGNPNPKFIYSLNSSMSYKNFVLSWFIQGTYGNDIYSLSLASQTFDYGQGLNSLREVLYNNWTQDNPNAKYPKISTTSSYVLMSDRFVYDGSYMRLKNIELAYSFPVDKFGIQWLKKGQIYVSGQNLLTITSYPWWDPDVNSRGGSSSLLQGIDHFTYPTAKGATFGIRLSF